MRPARTGSQAVTPRRAVKIAAAQIRIAAALALHRAGPDLVAREAALALVRSLTPAEVEVLRRMLAASHLLHLDPPPTRLHELGLVRPVPVRGGVDGWSITSAGVHAHCDARSLARRVSNPRK